MNKLDILLKEKNLITYTEYEDNKHITPIKKNSKFSILVIISEVFLLQNSRINKVIL